MGLSFGKSKSRSGSESQQRSFVDPNQEAFLARLRQQAQGLAGQQGGQIGSLFGLSQGLQGQGQNFLSNLQGTQQQLGQQPGGLGPGVQIGGDQSQQGINQLLGGAGAGIGALQGIAAGQGPSQAQQALQQQAFGQNPILGQQIGQLGQDINQQLQRQIGGAGGISAGAIGAGQGPLGGRAQVAQGIQGEAALNAFQRGATQLRGQDIGRQLGAAQALGGLEQGGLQQQLQAGGALAGLGQQGLGAIGQQQGLALQQQLGQQGLQFGQQQLAQQGQLGAGQLGLGGLGALGGQFNLGLAPFQGQFQPLQNLAGILGGPTVLSEGTSSAFGRGDAFNLSAEFQLA